MPPGELNEVAEKLLPEASPAGGRTDGERMHVSDRFGLREKAKQIRDDLGSAANDERRVSKLVNEEGMVQVAGIPRTPEFMQLIENLGESRSVQIEISMGMLIAVPLLGSVRIFVTVGHIN
jgi:hypothetical protein